MKFNSRIFAVALIPFYGYALMCAYILVHSHFQWDIEDTSTIFLISSTLIAAAFFASLINKKYHILSLLLYLGLGGLGVQGGLTSEPMNWPQLIASAFVVAFGIAFYEMIEHQRSIRQ